MLNILLGTFRELYYIILGVSSGGSFPRKLTSAEEADCLQRLSAGDQSARTRLIEHNLRLVSHITRKYYQCQTDSEDMLSVGTIGLIKAVDSYSSEKCTKFSSFASRCIEKATPSLRLYIVLKMKNESLFLKNGVYSKNRMQTAIFA